MQVHKVLVCKSKLEVKYRVYQDEHSLARHLLKQVGKFSRVWVDYPISILPLFVFVLLFVLLSVSLAIGNCICIHISASVINILHSTAQVVCHHSVKALEIISQQVVFVVDNQGANTGAIGALVALHALYNIFKIQVVMQIKLLE